MPIVQVSGILLHFIIFLPTILLFCQTLNILPATISRCSIHWLPVTCVFVDGAESLAQSRTVIVVYWLAGLASGFGYAPFYSLALTHIDDNAQTVHEASKYIGTTRPSVNRWIFHSILPECLYIITAVIITCYTIGPILGFGMGGLFLSKYVTLQGTSNDRQLARSVLLHAHRASDDSLSLSQTFTVKLQTVSLQLMYILVITSYLPLLGL